MPRVFSIDMEPVDNDFDDEEYDPYLVTPEEYQYLPAPDMGGPPGPVRVAVRPSEVGSIDNGLSMIDRMLGKSAPRQRNQWEIDAESTAARLATAIRDLGGTRAYMRYDGGNDEGFAWFDHCVFRDGSTRDAERLAKDLETSGFKLGMKTFSGGSAVREGLDDIVATTWSIKLLGQGYGTGEYVMYGAFSVDLETGVATDDPDPAPVTRNLRFKAD
jgi:hypothetical protein